eukprot:TRINITY_DN10992_c0_g4_i4.p1 TRINITY_DN10992_c0_g4~~TRINITY_DN10992_c0_g4_i4.p1  ORF type:complete len:163 (-),score=20.72 TRINITY_DN10992_c0_g4_i4:109-597(-)
MIHDSSRRVPLSLIVEIIKPYVLAGPRVGCLKEFYNSLKLDMESMLTNLCERDIRLLEDSNILKKLWEITEALLADSQTRKKEYVYAPLLKMLLKITKAGKGSGLLNMYKDHIFAKDDENKKLITEDILIKLLSIAIKTPRSTIPVIKLIQKFIVVYCTMTQ